MHPGLPPRPAGYLAGLVILIVSQFPAAWAGEALQKPLTDGETLAQVCFACHGERGVSNNPAVPSLAGQHVAYLNHALRGFQQGARTDPTMKAIVGQYSADELRLLAGYFAAQPYTRRPQATDPRKVQQGRAVFAKVCSICHPDNGKESSYAEYPRLAGQSLIYLQKSMADILSYRRPVDSIMRGMIDPISPEDLDNALHFFAAQSVGTTIVQEERHHPSR